MSQNFEFPLLTRLHPIPVDYDCCPDDDSQLGITFQQSACGGRHGDDRLSPLACIVLVLDGLHKIIQLIDLIV